MRMLTLLLARAYLKKRLKSKGKLGAKKGHPKWERKKPAPNVIVEYKEKSCPHCNSNLGLPTEIKEIIEEEIPKPQPLKVIKHVVNCYKCPKCQRKVISKNNAPRGCFGKNVQTHVTLLKFEDRLPLRRVGSSLERHYGLNITNSGIYGITKQVSRKLGKPTYEIIKDIRSGDIAYIDETKYKLNGQT